ncbi:beta-ketoacyl synthase N-terminal-like domain-containing protein [Cupriavidus basilensis]
MSRRRVVVTGLGPCVSGREHGCRGLGQVAGKSGIATVTKFDHSALAVHFAGEVKGFNAEVTSRPRKPATWIRSSTMASPQRRSQALKDSGYEVTEANAERIGVLVGSGIGGLPMIEDTHAELTNRGPRRISRSSCRARSSI